MNHEAVQKAVRALIIAMGDNPDRQGLLETPQRVEKALKFWGSGYDQDPAAVLKVFEDGAEHYDQMLIERNIPVWSLCEHHMAPFFGVAHIAYIPKGHIVGLSKLVRLTDIYARRLQVQERLTAQIADALWTHLQPQGVGVVLECRHSCMESRGVCKAGVTTTTSALFGAIKEEPETRAEFLHLVHSSRS